uniref:Uncharacterized protein n=1 Tax=Arundo donax TaxID=35708 RepID=A0A0A9G7D4_ARUDO
MNALCSQTGSDMDLILTLAENMESLSLH